MENQLTISTVVFCLYPVPHLSTDLISFSIPFQLID